MEEALDQVQGFDVVKVRANPVLYPSTFAGATVWPVRAASMTARVAARVRAPSAAKLCAKQAMGPANVVWARVRSNTFSNLRFIT